jgi:DNA ligase-1
VLLADLVATSDAVAGTGSRTAKRDAIATLLAAAPPDEIAIAVGFLMGDPQQGRIGVGWATLNSVSVAPAATPVLSLAEVDAALSQLAVTSGTGSVGARADQLRRLFARATEREADFLRRLLMGDLRQGALEGVMADAVAAAAKVPAASVRRAMMLAGDLRRTAVIALTEGRAGLDRVGLTVLHPIQPMLASTADDVPGALLAATGGTGEGGLVSIEWKLDGARIQIHRDGDDVRIFTRNLNDVSARLPGVAALVRALPARQLVLDAEVLGVRGDDRPGAFQHTMSRFGRHADGEPAPNAAVELAQVDEVDEVEELDDVDDELGAADAGVQLRPFFFDLLHVDGTDLIDRPLRDRIEAIEQVAGSHRIPGIVTADVDEADAFLAAAIAAGHEGVMVKDIESPYQAGRRGKAWRKVKPVHVFDLVVLAAEWGHGRRRGWLSNLHLGARDPADGSFVMVGKTFKGLTDRLLEWQTAALLEREIGREGITVHVRPELVVEIALDGVQASTRYPGQVALRFARVRRYRPDKDPLDADTIDRLQAMVVR